MSSRRLALAATTALLLTACGPSINTQLTQVEGHVNDHVEAGEDMRMSHTEGSCTVRYFIGDPDAPQRHWLVDFTRIAPEDIAEDTAKPPPFPDWAAVRISADDDAPEVRFYLEGELDSSRPSFYLYFDQSLLGEGGVTPIIEALRHIARECS